MVKSCGSADPHGVQSAAEGQWRNGGSGSAAPSCTSRSVPWERPVSRARWRGHRRVRGTTRQPRPSIAWTKSPGTAQACTRRRDLRGGPSPAPDDCGPGRHQTRGAPHRPDPAVHLTGRARHAPGFRAEAGRCGVRTDVVLAHRGEEFRDAQLAAAIDVPVPGTQPRGRPGTYRRPPARTGTPSAQRHGHRSPCHRQRTALPPRPARPVPEGAFPDDLPVTPGVASPAGRTGQRAGFIRPSNASCQQARATR